MAVTLADLQKRLDLNRASLDALKDSRDNLSEQVAAEQRRQDGLGEGRWRSRHRWGQPRHRKPPKRHVDPKARPRARGRKPRRCRTRRFTGPSGHRRRTPHELRRMLAQGAFAGWMHDSISGALKDKKRSVVICASCGGLTICPADDADKRWAEHSGAKQPTSVCASERPAVPHLSGTKRQRRVTLHRLRRMHRQRSSCGLLAQVRSHWQAKGWQAASADAFAMATITFGAVNGNWSDATKWVGGVKPTAADDVLMTVASANCTIDDGTAVCRSMDDLGYTGTLSGTGTLTIGDASGGACRLATGATYSGSWAVVFASTSNNGGTGWTITNSGKSFPGAVTFAGVGGKWVQADAFTVVGGVTFNQGTTETSNQTCNWLYFISTGSSTRVLTLGSSAITCTGRSPGFLSWEYVGTNLTTNANTSTITASASGAGFSSTSNQTWNSLVLSGAANNQVFGGGTFANLTRTGTAVKTDIFSVGASLTVTGVFTVTGNSLTNRVLVQSSTLGTSRTVTVNGSVSLTNVDFQDIASAGSAGTWTGTSLGDALGNSGITFTVAVTRYAVVAGNWSATATWSTTSGGGGGSSVPLPQDTVNLDASTAAGTYTADMPRLGANITCTGFTRTLSVGTNCTLYGNLTLASGMTFSGASSVFLGGRGSQTLTSAGKSFPTGLQCNAVGATYTLQDALSVTNAFTFNNGTFTCNGQTVSIQSYNSSSGATRTMNMGSGAWTLTLATAAAVWTATATGSTLNASTCIASCTGAPGGATTVTVTTATATMPNWTVNGGGNLTCQFSDAFTTAGTITLTAAKLDFNNQTVSCSVFSSSNSTTRTLTMGSSAITVTSGASSSWGVGTTTNLTVTANTATVTLTGSAAGNTVCQLGSINWNGLSLVFSGAGTPAMSTSPTIANLTRTGTAIKTDALLLNANPIVTGVFTATGNSVTNRVLVQSNTLGTTRTLTVNTTVTSTNADWQDITAAGTASWNLSAASGGSGDAQGNTGITFSVAQTNYFKSAAGDNFSTTAKWFLATNGGGGAGRVPLPQDTAVLDANTGSVQVTFDMPRFGTITATGFVGTFSFASVAATTYGDIRFAPTQGSNSGTQGLTLGGRGSQTITSNGKSFSMAVTLNNIGGTYTLQDAYNDSGALNVTTGSFVTGNFNVTVAGTFTSTGSATRAVNLGTSSVSLTQNSGTWWNFASTGLTLTANLSTLNLNTAVTVTRNFNGGGLTYGTVNYTVASSPGAVNVTGANTFSTVTIGAGRIVIWPSATTNTIATYIAQGTNYGYMQLVGVAGGYASTPDSAALSITSDFDVRVKVALADWTPAGNSDLLSKSDTSPQNGLELLVNTSGFLRLNLSTNGTSQSNVTSGVATGFVDGAVGWVRVTWRQSDGRVQFFTANGGLTSPQSSDWVQLGTDKTLFAGLTLIDTTTPLQIGATNAGGTGSIPTGNFYKADFRNTIADNGTGIVASPDFTAFTKPLTSFTDSDGNVWTQKGVTTGLSTTGETTLKTTTGASAATIALTNPVEGDFLYVQDITVTGAQALAVDSNNVSGNTGIIFSPPDVIPVFRQPRPRALLQAVGRAGSY